MKTWENASIEEISFTATAQGGTPSLVYDASWYDENGEVVVSFS